MLALCLLPLGLALAKAPAPASASPRLAIVIDDFGLTYPKDQPDADWMALRFPITFSVMPVSPRTRQAARMTLRSGHELMIHFPFDRYLALSLPAGHVDPADLAKVKALLAKAFAQIHGAKGLNNHQSLRATANRPMMRAFMKLLKPRGVFFLDSRVGPHSVAYAEARAAGIPAASNSIFLDGHAEARARRLGGSALVAAIAADKATCEHYLRVAAALARRRGLAVAIGHHYYRGTFQCLSELAPRLPGVRLVFASQAAR
ncbi:MAG: divergent polysaccharide deacetylase family protein [Elusimicrobia bacterium]|nr:divergent polysaccharide deacetylase family protein [Elusimicrobiota bacterium]MDE2236781.1 divergent polysaccharide deacetylase family protein [Elusimicrobiota bacterium]MDE2426105.1 divergent polysaccharide deacetylase family protein [Elusimicrobiota bacterium]